MGLHLINGMTGECINHFLTRKPSGDSSKQDVDGSKKLKRKELKKQMKDKKKRKSLDDDLDELATSWVGHVDPTKSKSKSSDPP